MKIIYGTCHLCGFYKKLSFEHVPPGAAFNKHRIFQARGLEIFKDENFDKPKGKISQLGSGGYTLCEQCNNDTGAWYGSAFVEWAHQAARILAFTRGQASLFYTYHIFPLRVLKQVVCMFFSANGPSFQSVHPDLVRFVLNKEEKYLDPKFRIYACLNSSNRSRQTGVVGALNFDNRKIKILSEITFPPFGFVMTLSSDPPDARLVDISFFARYSYNDWKHIPLNLPVLPVYSYLPGDYRSREEIMAHMANKPERE